MKNSRKGFIVPLLMAIIAVLVISSGVYLYKSKKTESPAVVNPNQVQQTNKGTQNTNGDKNLLTDALKSISVYTANGICDATRFDSQDNYFDYNPSFRCSYNSNLLLVEVVEKYKNQLKEKGWTCVYDEYLYQRAAGKRKAYSTTYFKNDFELKIYLTTLPEGIVWNGKQVEVSIGKISDNRIGSSKNACDSWMGFE